MVICWLKTFLLHCGKPAKLLACPGLILKFGFVHVILTIYIVGHAPGRRIQIDTKYVLLSNTICPFGFVQL